MVGDPAFGSTAEFKTMPTVRPPAFNSTKRNDSQSTLQLSLIETYPQLIEYDTDVYDYFKNQYVSPSPL